MIKVIYFDFFRVLCTPPYTPAIKKFIPEDIQKDYLDKIKLLDLGKISEEEFQNEISIVSNIPRHKIKHEIHTAPKSNKNLYKFISKNLKDKYKIGLLTNAPKTLIDRCLENPHIFIIKIISSEVKMIKPDKNIFDLAVKKANARPEEILLIDDSHPNIEVARSLGINTICYNDFTQFINEIETLLQL